MYFYLLGYLINDLCRLKKIRRTIKKALMNIRKKMCREKKSFPFTTALVFHNGCRLYVMW